MSKFNRLILLAIFVALQSRGYAQSYILGQNGSPQLLQVNSSGTYAIIQTYPFTFGLTMFVPLSLPGAMIGPREIVFPILNLNSGAPALLTVNANSGLQTAPIMDLPAGFVNQSEILLDVVAATTAPISPTYTGRVFVRTTLPQNNTTRLYLVDTHNGTSSLINTVNQFSNSNGCDAADVSLSRLAFFYSRPNSSPGPGTGAYEIRRIDFANGTDTPYVSLNQYPDNCAVEQSSGVLVGFVYDLSNQPANPKLVALPNLSGALYIPSFNFVEVAPPLSPNRFQLKTAKISGLTYITSLVNISNPFQVPYIGGYNAANNSTWITTLPQGFVPLSIAN